MAHIVEMQEALRSTERKIRKKLSETVPERYHSSIPYKTIFWSYYMVYKGMLMVLNRAEQLRFKTMYEYKGADRLQQETARLRYSWHTFSDRFLRDIHGSDHEHPSRIRLAQIVRDLVPADPDRRKEFRLLEVPCGNGTDYEYIFSKLGIDYYGAELNEKQVAFNNERLATDRFHVDNILSLSFDDRFFDVAYSRHIFEHIDLDPMYVAMEETLRVAKRTVIWVFFKMENIDDHIHGPVRKYHRNTLSRQRIEEWLQAHDRVQDVHVERISELDDDDVLQSLEEDWQDNFIFVTTLSAS